VESGNEFLKWLFQNGTRVSVKELSESSSKQLLADTLKMVEERDWSNESSEYSEI